jgi:glycerol-3-phosphate dehydrogenase subunit C
MVCPTGVRIAEINARVRSTMVEQGEFPLLRRLRNNLLARAELLGKLAQPIAPLANLALNLKPARWIAEVTLGIHRSAPFPRFSGEKFTAWYRKHHHSVKGSRQVAYFHGCSTQYYEPRVGKAAIQVLEANGFDVLIPQQNCCGLPLLSNGEFAAARRYHSSNVRHLVEYARKGIPIIGTSTSCTLTLKEEAPELLDMHDEDTVLVAQQIYDFNEFLLRLYEQGKLNTDFQSIPFSLGYHIPCQYRAHRIGRPGTQLLNLIPSLKIIESQADCCGIAGTYGFKQEKYEIAMRVGQPLFEFAQSLDGSLVVCDSETCRWQITHGTGIPSIHPVELLAEAYGFEPEGPLKSLPRHS